MKGNETLKRRVVQAAEKVFQGQGYVSALEVLNNLGWLQYVHLQDWKKGKMPYLEDKIQANQEKISAAITFFHNWARENGLNPHAMRYIARTREPKMNLQFSVSGDSATEDHYQNYYMFPLSFNKRTRNGKEKA